MINKSNDLPSFVNETNLPKIVDKLTDASNIKIANNKYGNRVQTVIDKIVEKADDVTKAIKQEVVNNSYSFKVGTGDVDVSADVEDGFGEVGIKGVTYQNIAYKNEYIPSNCSYSKETGEGVVNYNAPHLNGFNFSKDLLKPNTLYTVIINIKENSLVTTSGRSLKLQMAENNTAIYIANGFVGQFKVTISTKETIDSVFGVVVITSGATEGRIVFDGYTVLEGNHLDNPSIPSKISNIVGVGDKSKNLFNPKSVKFGITLNANTGEEMNSHVYVTSDFIPVLEKTDYMVKGLPVIHYYNESKEQIAVKNTPVEGVIRIPQNCKWIRMRNYEQILITEQKLLIKKSSFILGTYDTFEPHYDGHKIEILSSNKNLLNWKEEEFIPVGGSSDYGIASKDNLGVCFDCNGLTDKGYGVKTNRQFTLKPNTKYTLGCEWDILRGTTSLTKPFSRVHFPNTNAYIGWRENGYVTFTTDYTGAVVLMFYIDTPSKSDIKVRFKNMFLYEGETNSYIENNQDKTQILLDEPLMRLPNGVCDEITRDGKLIRRVGKIVLNGSEDYIASSSSENTMYFVLKNLIAKKSGYCMSNNFYFEIGSNDNEHIRLNANGNIVFWIKTSKLASQDSAGVKQWLSQNPTAVYYELAEPIITELPAPYLRIFKDGHLTFNTLVAPESTHVVQLNKSGQIQNAIKESQSLDNRINVLENNYDNLMLSTISRLNDLELNYTLK